MAARRPNYLFLMVDEARFPPVYESPAESAWRRDNLLTQENLRQSGVEFRRHYAGSCACAPSRATLFTGQYPTLHGVSQTDGAAKSAYDADMFWLDPNTVPTMGEYFRAIGYRTFYKGKWHISDADIVVPGPERNQYPSYDPVTGVPDAGSTGVYLGTDRLSGYGFEGWVGPEPHGPNPRNSGSSASMGLSGRDTVYADEAVQALEALSGEARRAGEARAPWLLVCSLVNPHDICLFGAITRLAPQFSFPVDESVPPVPPAPTSTESLLTKPRAQRSYWEVYPKAFQPLVDSEYYRRLYLQLERNSDSDLLRVFRTLQASPLYEDTVVIFTSDHGDLQGSHGGLFQKFYCAYEEAIHVPLIFHNPVLFAGGRPPVEMLTSHLDVLPTMLGLAGADIPALRQALRRDHTDARPLVGRDLSPLLLGTGCPASFDAPVLFVTDDDITRGPNQVDFLGRPYSAVTQPASIQTVVAPLGGQGGKRLWKYSRYFDNTEYTGDSAPPRDEYELYDLSNDPVEAINLANPHLRTGESAAVEREMARLLADQCARKLLVPGVSQVPRTRRAARRRGLPFIGM